MEEASFAMLETPPQKEKAPGGNAAEEADTATSKDKERPTRIDPTEAMQTQEEQLPPRCDTSGKDRWRQLPTDTRCKTVAELRNIIWEHLGGDIDIGKA